MQDVAEVKRQLEARAEEVARYLFPLGKRHGNEWKVGSLNGEEGESLQINLSGKVGVWSDFASGQSGGNLLELWIQSKQIDFRAALKACSDWLGIKDTSKSIKRAPRAYQKPKKDGIVKLLTPVERYLIEERKLKPQTLKDFRICSTALPEIVFPYLSYSPEGKPEAEMIKYLALNRDEKGKKVVRCSAGTKKTLFGKHLITGDDRYVICTEGECDAMSWHQVNYRALSVPFGAKWEGENGNDPNSEWIENDWDLLQSFERIYLSFDADEEGQKACQSILKRLGRERCFIIQLPPGIKDANEALQKGLEPDMVDAFENAKTVDPEQLKNATEYLDQVASLLISKDGAPISQGIPMPFEGKGGKFHWRMNEVTVISGYSGSGKSQLLGWLEVNLIEMGKRVLLFSMEVTPKDTLRTQVSQVLGKEFPDNMAELTQAVNWLGEGLWYYDHVGILDRKDLIEAMKYAFRRYGITFFVIDSFMKVDIDPDDYSDHKKFMNLLLDFSRDYPVHIIIVMHSRKAESELVKPGKHGVKGGSDLTDLPHNVAIVYRDKKKESEIRELKENPDKIEKWQSQDRLMPDMELQFCKQRNGLGEEPVYKLWYDIRSRQFSDRRKNPVSKLRQPVVDLPQAENQDEIPPIEF